MYNTGGQVVEDRAVGRQTARWFRGGYFGCGEMNKCEGRKGILGVWLGGTRLAWEAPSPSDRRVTLSVD